jgi:hypothetical protein
VALINFASPQRPGIKIHGRSLLTVENIQPASEYTSKDALTRDIMESVLIIQDYANMLRASSGKIITVSGRSGLVSSRKLHISGPTADINTMARRVA